jgi:threonylcarbamoyladenosine tRNA methylthiotransferase MtaB
MKVYLSTLGCKLNESELEEWTRRFGNDGHEIVGDSCEADLCVLNTCAITHVAARKSRQLARQLARANPKARLVVAGCFADIAPDEAKALPNVELVVANADKDRLVELAGNLSEDGLTRAMATGNRSTETESGIISAKEKRLCVQECVGKTMKTPHLSLRTRGFVKIQDGCNMSCTYCIIPIARGKERSRSPNQVIAEVRSLVEMGYKEIVLTGVQISAYKYTQENLRFGLRDIVAKILDETSIPRLRLTSLAPWDLDGSLLDLFNDSRLCRHLHLSLQSGSDMVLRRMRRPYTSEQFARTVELAREMIPDVAITTDVIVGFAGESDDEFDQSLRFVERSKFSRVHVFPYSARAGTAACLLSSQVSDSVKHLRAKRMQAVGDASLQAFAQRFIGETLHVLWESKEEANKEMTKAGEKLHGSYWVGYSDNYIRVLAPADTDVRNRFSKVRVRALLDEGVMSDMLES